MKTPPHVGGARRRGDSARRSAARRGGSALVRAARDRDIGVFQLGSVVRRTEPHVRYLLFGSVRGSCLSSFFCVTADFLMWGFL